MIVHGMLWGQGGCCRWWRCQEPQRGVRLIAATSAKTKASQSHPDPARLPICMRGKVVVGGAVWQWQSPNLHTQEFVA